MQRCGPTPCDCPPEEQAARAVPVHRAPDPVVQRAPLTSPCFTPDADLQDCRDNTARLTLG